MAVSIVHAVFFGVLFVLGVVLNGFVCFCHIYNRRFLMKGSRSILVCSLAFTDIFQSLLAKPLALHASINGRWSTGALGCNLYGFFCTWLGLSSLLHIALLSYERFYILSSIYLTVMPKLRVVIMVFSMNCVCLFVACLPLLGWSRYVSLGNKFHCAVAFTTVDSNHLSFTFFLLAAFFCSSLCVIVVSNVKLFFVVRRICDNANRTWGEASLYTQQTYLTEVILTRSLCACDFYHAWSKRWL